MFPVSIISEPASTHRKSLQLPNGWLWGMVDEFVYQFQSFQQYRGKLSQKSAEELARLRECGQVWDIGTVLNYLQAFVDKSGIVAELSTPGPPLLTQLPELHSCVGA